MRDTRSVGQADGMHEWWPDEIDYAGPEHLDDAYVAGYDAKAHFSR